METSLIIPTLGRRQDLVRCLDSVARLRPGFDEVIVVDQGGGRGAREVIDGFPELRATLVSLPAPSLPRARNAGIERAQGDCVFFVDDDTELSPGYVAAALSAFRRYPDAVGLTGPAPSPPSVGVPPRLKHGLYALLLVFSWRRNRVLRSGSNSFAHGAAAARPHEAQWLHGCSMVYRRRVFEDGIRCNTDLAGWAFGEDVELSYRVSKRYGRGALLYVPELALTHHSTEDPSDPEGRGPSAEALVRMKVVYRFLFWRREVYRGSAFNLLCYLWGQPGFVLYHLLFHLRARNRWRILRTAASAYGFLLSRRSTVLRDPAATNRFILHGTLATCHEAGASRPKAGEAAPLGINLDEDARPSAHRRHRR